ncbi:unnamed protein product [Protopolystoma xenopodis]|uniref:Major facilitator superfamily (MFS) profile domain-containing protein n=1 Tax=Protopolystoma xenopodis TaxID=117903 RepID=A0A3S5BZL4_9PLAT|nr:unnamed protein product [Protopolystoma xenopodis]
MMLNEYESIDVIHRAPIPQPARLLPVTLPCISEIKSCLVKNSIDTRCLFLGLMLVTFQQLTGVNVIFFYAESIFNRLGSENSSRQAAWLGFVQVLCTVAATIVVDRLSRRIMLVAGSVIMAIGLSALGFLILVSSK